MADGNRGIRGRDGRAARGARPVGRTRRPGREAESLTMFAHSATASAPASIGNVGVGFDILGQAFDAARDRVTAWREEAPGIRLGAVSGLVRNLPERPEANTALAAGRAVLRARGDPFGIRLDVEKGVP